MLSNREEQKVPSVKFRTRQNNGWLDVSTDEIFNGKTVVVFSLQELSAHTNNNINKRIRK